ncbi:MAG TPA: ATP-binding protein, partial [Candidatus Sulfopaludibacter sp.]|nr:ATP-binding protein [Candidatus Sulfopaludibacter sp.]
MSRVLTEAIKENLPVLLVGAPGVGKSDLVGQAAQAAGADLVISHPALQDPTDFGGIPWPDPATGQANFLPIAQVKSLLSAAKPTVWFLDDLGQAAPAVQASCMQWLLAREVHGMRLPPCVTILAATNKRGPGMGVSGFLEPVKSRFSTIIEVVPDLDDWCRWAMTHDVHPDIVAFLRYRPNLLVTEDPPSAEIVNRPSPRTWAFLSRWHAA